MPGTFSPPLCDSDSAMHHGTCVTHVPWCMPGSLTSGFLWRLWRRKRSRLSRRMRNPHCFVAGKRPILGSLQNGLCNDLQKFNLSSKWTCETDNNTVDSLYPRIQNKSCYQNTSLRSMLFFMADLEDVCFWIFVALITDIIYALNTEQLYIYMYVYIYIIYICVYNHSLFYIYSCSGYFDINYMFLNVWCFQTTCKTILCNHQCEDVVWISMAFASFFFNF